MPSKPGRKKAKRAPKGTPKRSPKGASKGAPKRTPKRTPKRSPKRTPKVAPKKAGDGERLQKVLAAAGLGSRRQCEELIRAGRVQVDSLVVTEMGTRVNPDQQEIRLDGDRINLPKLVYFAVNKPDGVISTNRDPSGRPRVVDLLPDDVRLFTVGRLDLHSEGLILLTNDGDLANRLTHPRYGVEKTYRVMVSGHPTPEVLAQLRRGVRLAEGLARVAGVTLRRKYKQSAILEMVLREGQNREIRRVLARLNHKVLRLVRISVGPVRLGKLPSGEYRRLTKAEVKSLQRAVKTSATKKREPKADKPRAKR